MAVAAAAISSSHSSCPKEAHDGGGFGDWHGKFNAAGPGLRSGGEGQRMRGLPGMESHEEEGEPDLAERERGRMLRLLAVAVVAMMARRSRQGNILGSC